MPLSALDGVPITIKDNIAVAGLPAPLGTAAGEMSPCAQDAPPVARVREAGCVFLGKTTMPDYGMLVSGVSSLHGITRNPWNHARNRGGSSSGAGAGMAAGYAPLALGTDIGGSVRLPAAYNGVFALKPSLGRVPIYPPFLGRVVGPITRTVGRRGAPDDGAGAARRPRLHGAAAREDRVAARSTPTSPASSSASCSTSASARSRSRRCGPRSRPQPQRSNAPARSSSRSRRS